MDISLYLEWLSSNGFRGVATLLSLIFGLVIMIVQLLKYKFNCNQAKESSMKYRTENYQSAKGYVSPSQTFKRIVPVYELDDTTNELVVVGTKDLQALIQSSRDCGLDVVLEKYGVLPVPSQPFISEKSDEVFDATDLREDLIILSEYQDAVEDLRVRYNKPDSSPTELFKFISDLKAQTDKTIQSSLEKQISISEVKKDEI